MADTDSDINLNERQSEALFDILTHNAIYTEICKFKSPEAIRKYGTPFQDGIKTTSPILHMLLSRFALTLPGLRDISPDFWKIRVEKLVEDLSAAELSESYDKGVLGIRKTLATAVSALFEYPTRGCLGGFPKDDEALKQKTYDPSNPDDVLNGWTDFLQQLVYGDLFDKLFAKAAETDDLKQHDTLVQAAHEFVVVNLASFMHYTLVLSPEGPSLLRMLESVHKLAPYILIRQTLRIGNVATMLSGMVRLLLAKISLGSVTNWMGFSSGADEGMNLLQQIINQVLKWDKNELKKRAEQIEKDKDAPSAEVRKVLTQWTTASRAEHLECRSRSQEQSISIVAAILAKSSAKPQLSDAQHAKALEYLQLQLSIHDRTEIVRVLCRSNPDNLTQAVRDGVSAYEPMIRQVHQAVDLSATLGDLEAFINDMIKLSKPKKDVSAAPPAVEDFVALLHKHMSACHRFLHQVAKNGKEVTQWFHEYVRAAADHFVSPEPTSSAPTSNSTTSSNGSSSSDSIPQALATAFAHLSASEKATVRAEADACADYIDALHSASAARIRDVVTATSTTRYGPGAFLARWQNLLDSTLVTPDRARGPLRSGADPGVKLEGRRDVDGAVVEGGGDAGEGVAGLRVEAPGTEETVRLLGDRFRELLIERVA